MPIRNLDEVFVPANRLRKEFPPDALEALIASILDKGLLHPPVVETDGALLVGERRLRALRVIAERGETHHCNGKFLRPGLIFTTDIRELTPVQRMEAELEENTIRLDLSWQDKANAVAALHALRQAQKDEQALPGLAAPRQTPAETAAEIHGRPEATVYEQYDVRADLSIAAWLDSHPGDTSVSQAKSRAEALKAMEIQLENEHRAALARVFLARYRETDRHIIRLANILDILPETPDNLYDCIITDPPWGIGADKWANGDSERRHDYADDAATSQRIHEALAWQGYRIAKPKAHLYCFCAQQNFNHLAALFRAAGWDVWPRPLIWFRGSIGIAPRPEHGPKNTYECILFANKGDKRTLTLRPDVIIAPKPATDPRAAAKPVMLYHDLMARSCVPGDEVLDPCCGSAPVLPAANALRLRATCYDIAEDAIGLASSRMAEEFSPTLIEVTSRAPKRQLVRSGRGGAQEAPNAQTGPGLITP